MHKLVYAKEQTKLKIEHEVSYKQSEQVKSPPKMQSYHTSNQN